MDMAGSWLGPGAGSPAAMLTAAAPVDDGQANNLWERLLFKIELVPVTTIWWVVGFGVAALLFLALAVYVRPKKWMILFVPLVLVFTALAVGFAVNLKFHAFTTLGPMLGLNPYETGDDGLIDKPEGTYPRGVVVDATIPGRVSGLGELPAKVWLPPQWFTEPSRTFPVVFLLHGVPGFAVPGLDPNGGPATLFTSANADNGAQLAATQRDQPVVLIAPVNSPMNADTECVDGTQGKWQTYLSTDLINWTGAHPRMQKGPEHTGISGYSMGGYCAQVTALRNPSKFSISGNLSGCFAPDYPDSQGGLAKLFGVDDVKAAEADYDSIAIVQTQPASHSVRVWLRIGTGDNSAPGLIESQQKFAAAARDAGMTVEESKVPGGHDFKVWDPGFAAWIQWCAALLYGQQPQ